MHCPFCQAIDTKVTDSRFVSETNQVRRRRLCTQCEQRFTTYETIEVTLPRVIKRDDSAREAFSEVKLRQGIEHALEKRPVSTEAIDAAIIEITHKIRSLGEKEIPSKVIGEIVMKVLKKLDEVAYVRFASVYRRFQDIESFKAEIDKMLSEG